MSTQGLCRSFAIASLAMLLAAVSACGQMGPLQLPDNAAPVANEDSQEEDREDDER